MNESKHPGEALPAVRRQRYPLSRHGARCTDTSWVKRTRTCLEVGDDGPAGEGSFGGVEGYRVAGAWFEVWQLVLLLVAFHKESISCHWKTDIYMFTTCAASCTYFYFLSFLSKQIELDGISWKDFYTDGSFGETCFWGQLWKKMSHIINVFCSKIWLSTL